MRTAVALLLLSGLAADTGRAGGGAAQPVAAEHADFFEKHVRPVLAENCYNCHGPRKQMSGLRLDSRAALLRGGDNGPVVKPGDAENSPLIQAVRHAEGVKKMPPKSRLKSAAVEALAAWVKLGLPWPETVAVKETTDWRRHWAFQPVRRPAPPVVAGAWVKTPVDQFIAAALGAKGLTASGAADRRTLVRRATFDLTGLPPTPEDLERALQDPADDWFEKVVDRLLASPQYGERWGRHWLDVARYADTKGYIILFEESDFAWAYTYRDYVVRAFNEDLPYDRFLVEQLAADRLVETQGASAAPRAALPALGFLTLGSRFMSNPHDIIDDRIDVATRGLMGLTVSCARCHDHKFDPIPAREYYGLYGVFASSPEPVVPPLFTEPPATPAYAAFEKELQAREQRLVDFVRTKHAELVHSVCVRAGEYLQAAHALRGQPDVEEFMFVSDAGDLNPRVVHRWQVHLERTRKEHDPVFAAWHAFAALRPEEFTAKAGGVAGELRGSGRPVNPLLVNALADRPPKSMADVARVYGTVFRNVEHLWQESLQIADELGAEPPTRLDDPASEEVRQALRGPDAPAMVPLRPFGDLDLLPDRGSQAVHQKLRKALDDWRVKGPGAPPRALTLEDAAVPFAPYVFIRGNPSNRGAPVPRQFLGMFSNGKPQPFKDGSGRLELARAIASKDNPLTARVMVNRVWMHHFGSPLVATPGDFGTRSQPPTHPELLDWLAGYFMDNGWSVKKLHRVIMLSAAYRQASEDRPECTQVDPENTLVWKMNRRRLDFEALRDALLASAGTLDTTVGGPPVKDIMGAGARRRTLYGYLDRQSVPGLYRTFDFPSPDATTPRRDSTTVAPQALFLMNHPFVASAARKVLQRADVVAAKEPARKVERVYLLLYGRPSSQRELALAHEYLAETGPAGWERYVQALFMANEFAFVD